MGQRVIKRGDRYGRWTVIGDGAHLMGRKCIEVQCACGVRRSVRVDGLLNGASQSCGCRQRAIAAEASRRMHRERGHTAGSRSMPESKIWHAMKQRCGNPNSTRYAIYGGRGISVCARWRSFEAFLSDMGPRPSRDHSIDRINVNGDYEPANCRWATRAEQGTTMRRSRPVRINGAVMSIRAAAKALRIPESTLYRRACGTGVGIWAFYG